MEYLILVLDEDVVARRRLAEALIAAPPPLGASYRIIAVGSAAAAQLQASRHSFRLLIATLRLSGGTLDLCERLRELAPQIGLLLIHEAGASKLQLQRAERLGAHLVVQPCADDQLAAIAAVLLGLSQPATHPASDTARGTERAVQRQRAAATVADVQLLLDVLRRQAYAQLAIYTDNIGNVIASRGDAAAVDLPSLSSLIAGGFINAVELGRMLHDPETVHLSVHEGKHYDVYSANVGSSRVLALLFDKERSVPKLGFVWLLLKRAAEQLARMQIVDDSLTNLLVSDELHESFNAHFDELFGDELVGNG